jgi:hypothetical protein
MATTNESADIAWLRFEGYDPSTAIAEETEFGHHEIDPTDHHLVGLQYWQASKTLPEDLLKMLPSPPITVAG